MALFSGLQSASVFADVEFGIPNFLLGSKLISKYKTAESAVT